MICEVELWPGLSLHIWLDECVPPGILTGWKWCDAGCLKGEKSWNKAVPVQAPPSRPDLHFHTFSPLKNFNSSWLDLSWRWKIRVVTCWGSWGTWDSQRWINHDGEEPKKNYSSYQSFPDRWWKGQRYPSAMFVHCVSVYFYQLTFVLVYMTHVCVCVFLYLLYY